MNRVISQNNDETIIELVNSKSEKFECLIDSDDYAKIKDYHWYAHLMKSGKHYVHSNGSVCIHRIIMNLTNPKLCVDHINGDTLDNRKSNLRVCTWAENLRNRKMRKGKSVLYYGVSIVNKNKYKKFRSRIIFNYIAYDLGTYYTPEEAARAYNNAAKIAFGEFARLNEIPGGKS